MRLPIVPHAPRVRRMVEIAIRQHVLRRIHPELEERAAGAGPAVILFFAILQQPARADIVSGRSEEHTSELQSLMRISYAVFCLNKKNNTYRNTYKTHVK